MREGMFSLYIVWYLFLAGTGSGAYALAAVLGFVGQASGARSVQEYGRIADGGFLLGPLLVALGAVFLLFDLGSPERAWLVIVSFRPSLLTLGVWAILLFLLISGTLILLRYGPQLRVAKQILLVLRILALLLALVVMTYTGIYLASMRAIPFLYTWLLVALLITSSLTAGSATITLYGFLNQHRKAMRYSLRLIPRVDILLIIMEAAGLSAYLLNALTSGGLAQHSAQLLLADAFAPAFWAAVVVAGLGLPLVVALVERCNPRAASLAVGALGVLVGGFALRWCIIEVSLHLSAL